MPANWFNTSFVGPEVQLSVGFIDLHEIASAIASKGGTGPLSPVYQGRFVMSVQSFVSLHRQINELAKRMNEAGMNLDQVEPLITHR